LGEQTETERRKPPAPTNRLKHKRIKIMKSLMKLVLAAAIFCTTLAAQAGSVSGYYRSNGTYIAPYYRSDSGSLRGSYSGYSSSSRDYVYRNPYAAYPSVSLKGYLRSNGTYVAPYHRTPPNNTVTDNLSYRGFGTIRVPKTSYRW
jgi:hypothetical protein